MTNTIIAKIDQLIAKKRAPLEARQQHLRTLTAEIATRSAKLDEYFKDPTPQRLKDATRAEGELVAMTSLRERMGEVDIDRELEIVLNSSFEATPLFAELAQATAEHLKACHTRAREYRIAAAGLDESDPLLDVQVRLYAHQIAEAEKLTAQAQRWSQEWALGKVDQYWNFWSIYRTLKGITVPLYPEAKDMPIPENYQPPQGPVISYEPRDNGRVLIPGHEPEEGTGVLSINSTSNH